uniref:Uncharacterized protein n=1 Tax=Fusarium oxysporum (strain Fo5176) TaxID=660025 RepID=A0A0D2XAM1_FUSOF
MLDKKWMEEEVPVVSLGQEPYRNCHCWTSLSSSSWLSNWRNHDRGQSEQHRDGRRPLLIDRERDVIEEEETAPERPERSSPGYGSVHENESGPRVVPSAVIERNNWTED